MKKVIVILLTVLILPGCLFYSDAYYQSQNAYYQAQTMAYQAQAHQAAQPVAVITTQTGETITIAKQSVVAAPVIRTQMSPFADVVKTAITSTPMAIVAGGWSVMKLLKYSNGTVKINGSDNTVTTTKNSNNTTEVSTATDKGVVDQHQDSSDNSDNSDNSNNSDNRSDYENQTAEPTIVVQPDPVIVDPMIVNPVIVDPMIVNPVIVDPVIIQPTATPDVTNE